MKEEYRVVYVLHGRGRVELAADYKDAKELLEEYAASKFFEPEHARIQKRQITDWEDYERFQSQK